MKKKAEIDIDKKEKRYIQVVGLNDIDKIEKLKTMFNIQPFIMEDIINVGQRTKFEYTEEFIFASFDVIYMDQNIIKKDYMSMLYLDHTIITFHEAEPLYLEAVLPLLQTYQEVKTGTSDLLFYFILDMITDEHLEIYDELDDKMIAFEEEILESKDMQQESFYLVRKQMLQLKNIITPMNEQFEKILQRKIGLIHKENQLYFEDLNDHLQRLDLKLNQSRDMMRQLLDLHMNNQSTRMNQIMSTLTLFSAIFIPLSFLTGFFGMNFKTFGLLEAPYGVIIFTIVCIFIMSCMFIFFKKKKWF
ncbi:hypothetical protein KHQ89_00055 [Mycoplasmatota bacterium]|nr:hypothetical protein KHQ89_00055 [Mycoplasmatota bacterium]